MNMVITLIGSTKFVDIFREVEEILSYKGYLVFTPSVYSQSGDNSKCGKDIKIILDNAQRNKILRSNVAVIDKDRYIGNSTKDKIAFASFLHKSILYFSKGDIDQL